MVGSECSLAAPSGCRTAVPEWGWQDRTQPTESSREVHFPSGGTLVSPHWQSQLCWGCQHWTGYACSQLALFWKEPYGEIAPCWALCLAVLFSLLRRGLGSLALILSLHWKSTDVDLTGFQNITTKVYFLSSFKLTSLSLLCLLAKILSACF